jgi:hypothetical protein
MKRPEADPSAAADHTEGRDARCPLRLVESASATDSGDRDDDPDDSSPQILAW